MLPLISIIITSYNRGSFIGKAIESARAQDYQNIEIIVIDNCSKDDSDRIISGYSFDPRIKYIKNDQNLGAVPSMIKAIGLAKGDYFTHVSSDDYLVNNTFISDAVALINKYPGLAVVSAKNIFFNQSTEKYSSPATYRHVSYFDRECVEGKEVFLEYVRAYPITMGACIMDREKFISLNHNKPAPIYYDLQVIMQLLLLGNAGFINKESYLVRIHESNLSAILRPASVNIDNYMFIEAPYHSALALNVYDGPVIKGWYKNMLTNYSFHILKDYYKKDKVEFKIFKDFVKLHYPEIFVEILKNPKWYLIILLYKYPFIGNVLNKLNLKIRGILLSAKPDAARVKRVKS